MTFVKMKQITSTDIIAQRKKLGLNQTAYWSRVGVTQSGGSRYESGRKIPKPIQILIVIAFGTPKQCETIVQKLREPS